MKCKLYKTLMIYGKIESLIEQNITPPLEYWRVEVYKIFRSDVYNIAKDLSKEFDTYMFRAAQTEDGVFIYIYKKRP